MDGILVIDKPVGLTSHDVVARVRRVLGERRIGHTGTLDPGASGVLPLVVGRATRLARFLSAGDKSYDAVIELGFSTDTGDAGGTPVNPGRPFERPSRTAVESALDQFRGTFLQQPPAYSAKKIDGTRSYRLARRRKRQDAPPALPALASVTASAIDVVGLERNNITLRIVCSAGFYVRSLAHDLGEWLGTGGHLVELRRTRSGDFTLADAIALDVIERDRDAAMTALVPPARTLLRFSSVVLTVEGTERASHGRDLDPSHLLSIASTTADPEPGATLPETRLRSAERRFEPSPPPAPQWVKLLDAQGTLVGIGRVTSASGTLHPSVVLE